MSIVCAGLVTYNRSSLLKRALEALLAQNFPVQTVFVVNNASTDDTRNVLESFEARFPGRVKAFHNTSNDGSAGGFHLAAKMAFEAGADWIWLMDDDAIPFVDTLANLMQSPAAVAPDTGGLGCLVVDEAGKIFPPNLACQVDRAQFSFRSVAVAEDSRAPVRSDTNSFDGFLVHRRAIMACGLPRKEFFLWWDDIEFSLRISSLLKIWQVPTARILHLGELRSDERAHPLFRAKIQVYDWNGCWRMYYRSRNFYAVARQHASPGRYYSSLFKHLVKELLSPLLFKQDHPVERWRLSLKAALDGHFARLGKTVEISPPFRNI